MMKLKPVEIQTLERELLDVVGLSNQDLIQENANVDGTSPMGMMMNMASASGRILSLNLFSDEVKEAIDEKILYPHDLDMGATGTTTCCQIPLGKILKDGFNTGHGHMREPSNIMSAMALAAIILQSHQNMQHGGQSFPNWDFDLAPYVEKTFWKNYDLVKSTTDETIEDGVQLTHEWLKAKAMELTEKQVYQACEAFIHNINSMHARGGGQIIFASINYGLDTSVFGRMITRNTLKALQAGLGNGEAQIFPIHVFKVKKGVNTYEGNPNYDLFELALETTAKRLFPNFLFVDAPFNMMYYKENDPMTHPSTMGCRTRVQANINGESTTVGRGNLSFSTLNLPKIALMTGEKDLFFKELERYINLGIKQLLERYKYQCSRKAKQFKFMYSQNSWMGSENLEPNDTLEEVLKHGTLSLGFIGLAETLTVLIGEHHGQSRQAFELGYSIISFMRAKMDEAAKQYKLNFSLIATPAESLCRKIAKWNQEEFGIVKDVTDRNFVTNSFHVPVWYPITAYDKIKTEAPFHELCNAGHISYIETDGKLRQNKTAVRQLVHAMMESGIGYGSINHPVDHCLVCDYDGSFEKECPSCGNKEEQTIRRVARITGYLVGDINRWNTGKQSEYRERLKHMKADVFE